MNIALMISGFVRLDNNMQKLRIFLENNSKHTIDIYSSTYNIKGLEQKEHNDPSVYMKSGHLKDDYFDSLRKTHNVTTEIEDYEESSQICKDFIKNNLVSMKKGNDDFWKRSEAKLRDGFIDDESNIRRSYAQWRKVYKTYNLIQTPKKYDLLVRSRYDYIINELNLDNYQNISDNDMCVQDKTSGVRDVIFNNGERLKYDFYDGLAIGKPEAMKKYCSHGSEDVFRYRMNSDECEADNFYNRRGASAKLSNELFCSFLCFHLHNLDHVAINEFNIKTNRSNKTY